MLSSESKEQDEMRTFVVVFAMLVFAAALLVGLILPVVRT